MWADIVEGNKGIPETPTNSHIYIYTKAKQQVYHYFSLLGIKETHDTCENYSLKVMA